ncbi:MULTISPECIES: hypothetical protein [Legionella]|uniref:Uncharacterized protein n=1 Tax=Legionella drozanskii LLAP-1 TaxID=1212489 RepID=A0A0W0SX31_9GAMM|nr:MULTISPECIES: hypothetical protein [Legionella]KTC87820.1 hypothetical protein Ldro_1439 [Legionella drozanskii LLAP-1]
MEQYQKDNSEHGKNIKGIEVSIAEVNSDSSDPIVPGEGNRNFDDPVTSNKEEFSDQTD